MTREALSHIAEGLAQGTIVPYLGPEVLNLGGASPAPTSTRALVERLTSKVAVPGRIRNNLWSSAQWIESNKHRQTLVRLMEEVFSPVLVPNQLHELLASLKLPLIVDSWYDSSMAQALAAGQAAKDWGMIQAITRNGEWQDVWYRFFDSELKQVTEEQSQSWKTVLYKPHGSIKPEVNFLLSDSDYVEVLTEIDIQTPIPAVVKDLRSSRGFVFLGCRFYDQMERTYARQITKRSMGPHYAVLPGEITRNEERFLEVEGIIRLDMPLAGAVNLLAREAAAELLA